MGGFEKTDTGQVDLTARFSQNLEKNTARLQALLKGNLPPVDLHTAHEISHKIAGSAGTFGAPDVGNTARCIEHILALMLTRPYGNRRRHDIDELRALGQTLVDQSGQFSQIGTKPKTQVRRQLQPQPRLVYYLDDDAYLGAEVTRHLSRFGYTVEHYLSFEQFEAAFERLPPQVILADIIWPGNEWFGISCMQKMRSKFGYDIPVIFVSGKTDLQARINAVFASGVRYFTKPIDYTALVEALDEILHVSFEPHRVLLVDEDHTLDEKYIQALEKENIVTAYISSHQFILETIQSFRPELIVLDIYLGKDIDILGSDLAKAIQQHEDFLNIPIIFLTSETELDVKYELLQSGADLFLNKPISPEHLSMAVSARLTRSRDIQNRMSRDSLTHLLTHGYIKENLRENLERYEQDQEPLSIAILDLDHFKQVNDSYGHQTGDAVLRSIARVLLQNIRHVENIGRYGGEEFLIILPDYRADDALALMDEIRTAFEQIRHMVSGVRGRDKGRHFQVTFSCGVADTSISWDADELLFAADKALYEAKAAGRNRCILVDSLER